MVSGRPARLRIRPHVETQRSEFSKLITDYVLKCEKMHFLFVLADIRLEPQKIDLRFIEMLGENGIPFGIIFTKADKLSKTQREKSVERFRTALAEQWGGTAADVRLLVGKARGHGTRPSENAWISNGNRRMKNRKV